MEQQVTNEQMNALKALSDTNMKVSDAKATLIKIEETKQHYFNLREIETKERIDKIISDSSEVLAQARNNYYETTQFYNTVSTFADAITVSHETFQAMIADFEERNKVWELSMSEQEEILTKQRQGIENDKKRILNDKKSIERANLKVENEKRLIESRQAQIKSALAVLKNKKNG